jgi:hypothetical protein
MGSGTVRNTFIYLSAFCCCKPTGCLFLQTALQSKVSIAGRYCIHQDCRYFQTSSNICNAAGLSQPGGYHYNEVPASKLLTPIIAQDLLVLTSGSYVLATTVSSDGPTPSAAQY